jgi:hypothetical protein
MLELQAVLLALVLSGIPLWARDPNDEAPAAPVPLHISAGKKVFVSNAQGESSAATAVPKPKPTTSFMPRRRTGAATNWRQRQRRLI